MSVVRIPADIDREDRLLAGLTARQLAYVALGVVVLAALWSAASSVLAPPLFLFLAAPVVAAVAALALLRRDGLPADRLALAWWRSARGASRRTPAPEGVPALPRWAPQVKLPAPLEFPAVGVDGAGTIDLGEDGRALVCRATSLNFGLRTAEEQAALVAVFGRWLNSLSSPMQILVRAEGVDVGRAVAALVEAAPALPHPALEAAAHEHAAFLADLAARRDVLRRVALVVFRQPADDDGGELLARQADDASRALAGAGITLTPLGYDAAVAALAHAADADAAPRPAGLSGPADVIRGTCS